MKSSDYPVVTTVCVAICLVFYTLLNEHLSPMIGAVAWASPLVSGMATIGLYLLLFKALLWLYTVHVEDMIHKDRSIRGEWIYRLIIEGRANPRFGKCRIEKGASGLYLSGVHFHPGLQVFTSQFFSEAIEIDESEVLIRYRAVGVDQQLDSTKGMFFLQTVGVPPDTIHGFWADVLPIRNAGSVTFVRCNSDTEEILASVGYPDGGTVARSLLGMNHGESEKGFRFTRRRNVERSIAADGPGIAAEE